MNDKISNSKKPVVAFHWSGKIIKYESITDAAKDHLVLPITVSRAVDDRNRKITGSFFFTYNKDEHDKIINSVSLGYRL